MNQETIIRMAREAGSIDSEDVILTVYAAFAAHEREKLAEQEPVAWMWKPSKPFPQYTVITDNKEHLKAAKEQGVEITPLYAAPVRTKDLTDDEITKATEGLAGLCGLRAVIAADREKNK